MPRGREAASMEFGEHKLEQRRREVTDTNVNGRAQRKTLATQLDRLDAILDGLADALNGAVADAVRAAAGAAVQEAVRQALVEVLTNPDVLTLIGGAAGAQAPAAAAPEVPPAAADSRPGLRERLGAVGAWVGRKVRAARRGLGGLAARLAPLWQLRRQLLVALGIGAAAAVAVYFCSPWVASVLSGLLAFASTLTVQARLW